MPPVQRRLLTWRLAAATHGGPAVLDAESPELPPERARLREAVTGVTRHQLDASSFDDAAALAALLRRARFEAVVRRQVDETPTFSSLCRLALDLLDRLRPALRV